MAKLVEPLNKASTACGMEISGEKSKLMTNNTSGMNTEIKVNGQKFETVTSFKYLCSVITDKGSKPEILFRKAQTTLPSSYAVTLFCPGQKTLHLLQNLLTLCRLSHCCLE